MAVQGATGLRVVEAKRVIDKIVRTLQKNETLIVNEIIKGGSMGQGTIVPGFFDVDLVVYSESVDRDKAAREGFEDHLDKLDEYFSLNLTGYEKGKNNGRSLQFCYDKVDVDLLLSPNWERKEDFYEHLKALDIYEQRERLSCSASKWQVEFVKNQPDKIVFEYIKRAKAWRRNDPDVKKSTKSYLIVLLVIKAYEEVKLLQSGFITPTRILEKLKELVKQHKQLRICWTKYYNEETMKDFDHQAPYIIDPANPANNVYFSGVNGDDKNVSWSKFRSKIDDLDLALPIDTEPMERRQRKSKLKKHKRHNGNKKFRDKSALKAKREARIQRIKDQATSLDLVLTRAQKEFIEAYPMTHNYIKYMIAWSDVIWEEHDAKEGKPTSYLIALLVIKAYEISTDKSAKSIQEELLNLIFGRYKMRIFWNYTYDDDSFQYDSSKEFIIDPTNPTKNLFVEGIISRSHEYHHRWGCFRFFANKGIIIQL